MVGKESYARKPSWIQRISPAPKRFLQELIETHDLRSGLDIGCGLGSPLSHLRSDRFHSTGIDIHAPSVEVSRQHNVHDEYIVGDFLNHEFSKKFDVIMLSHSIEHFARDDGMMVLRRIDKLAPRLVYIETPNGFLEQIAEPDNPWQRHISGWFAHDFEARGYTVFGAGLKMLRGPNGRAKLFPEAITRTLERASQFYAYRHPKRSHAISAMRLIDERGDVRQL